MTKNKEKMLLALPIVLIVMVALFVCLTDVGVARASAERVICSCGLVDCDHMGTSGHNSVTLSAWSGSNSLPTDEGGYYLTGDVTLTDVWSVSEDIILDLCGYAIVQTASTNTISISASASLTIYDSGNTSRFYDVQDGLWTLKTDGTSERETLGGIISGGEGRGIFNDGTLYLYGGNIVGNKAQYGGGIVNNYVVYMYGGSIIGNVSAQFAGGVYNQGGGTFEMHQGKIRNNTAVEIGGGVDNDGDFVMNGGAISNNISCENGGGVHNASKFVMNGGEISYNSSNQGGGIYNIYNDLQHPVVELCGGSIINNTALIAGGGVFDDYDVYLNGEVTITGNTVGGKENNLLLNQIEAIISGNLGNSKIGVTYAPDYNEPTISGAGTLSSGLDTYGTADNFEADDDALHIIIDGEAKLEAHTFDGEWDNDVDGHSRKCSVCQAIDGVNRVAHVYNQNDGTECVCGRKLYTITFCVNGGEGNVDAIVKTNGAEVTEPSVYPTMVGHKFEYWYADNDTDWFALGNRMPEGNLTLNAKWVVERYQVYFDLGYETTDELPSRDDVYYATRMSEVFPVAPNRDGYQFVGWYNGEQAVNAQDKMWDCGTDGSSVTLTAVWALNPPTISKTGEDFNGAYSGAKYTMSVDAQHALAGLCYQWYKRTSDGAVEIEGATDNVYLVGDVADSGTYYCEVSVSNGGQTSKAQSEDYAIAISKRTVDVPSVGSKNYTGGVLSTDITSNNLYTVDSAGGVDVGEYQVTVSLVDCDNYRWASGDESPIRYLYFEVKKSAAVITVDTTPINVQYGDVVNLPIAQSNLGDVYCDTLSADLVERNIYTVTYSVAPTDNYKGDTKTITVTIAWRKVAAPTADITEFVYDGEEHTYQVTPSAHYTVDGTKRTDAGTQTVTISLVDKANSVWVSGGTKDITFDFVVKKATYDMSGITFDGMTVKENGRAFGLSIKGELPVGIDGVPVEVVYHNNFNSAPGRYVVTASFVGSSNYEAIASKTAVLVIKRSVVKKMAEGDGAIAEAMISIEQGVDPDLELRITRLDVEEIEKKFDDMTIVAVAMEMYLFNRSGDKVLPSEEMTVSILLPVELVGKSFTLVNADGEITRTIDYRISGGYVVFTAENLGDYYFVYSGQAPMMWLVSLLGVLLCYQVVTIVFILLVTRKRRKAMRRRLYSVAPFMFSAILPYNVLPICLVLGILNAIGVLTIAYMCVRFGGANPDDEASQNEDEIILQNESSADENLSEQADCTVESVSSSDNLQEPTIEDTAEPNDD